LHGFIHERGKDNLEDYFMCGMEWKSNDDKLKITPVGGNVKIKDLFRIKRLYYHQFGFGFKENISIFLRRIRSIDRIVIVRAFVTKAVYNYSTTRELLVGSSFHK